MAYNEWTKQAQCAGMDSQIFFCDKSYQRALMICGVCPVTGECLEYALDVESKNIRGGRHGVFGGTLPEERAKIARKRKPLDVVISLN